MFKLVTLLKLRPGADIDSFERHYREVHIPLARRLPGLKKYTRSLVHPSPRREAPYYRVAELYFEDYASLRHALASTESQTVLKDAGFFCQVEDMVQFIAEEEELPLP